MTEKVQNDPFSVTLFLSPFFYLSPFFTLSPWGEAEGSPKRRGFFADAQNDRKKVGGDSSLR